MMSDFLELVKNKDIESLQSYLMENEITSEVMLHTLHWLIVDLDGENDLELSEMLKLILAKKSFDLPDLLEAGTSPLVSCVCEQSPLSLKALLEKGFMVNVRDDEGRTPLTEAVLRENLPCLELLLQYMKKENINVIGSHLATSPLGLAYQKGNLVLIALLLRYGADSDLVDIDNGYHPITTYIPAELKPEID